MTDHGWQHRAYLDAALRRMRLGVRVRNFAALNHGGDSVWAVVHPMHRPSVVDTPREATEAYLALCRMLESQ